MSRILLVEDSIDFQKVVVRVLGHHQIICVDSVEPAMEQIRNQKPDLVLLDLHLPGKSGYSLLSEIQSTEGCESIPVICLTGQSAVTYKIAAFSLGAEDYIVKPFDPIEFKARVDAKLSRLRRLSEKENQFVWEGLEVDFTSHRVSILENGDKKTIDTTQTEFILLCCLIRRLDQVYTRDQLLVAAWGENAKVLDRVVDVHLCSLRKKLKSYGHVINAVPGFGYRFSTTHSKNSKKAA